MSFTTETERYIYNCIRHYYYFFCTHRYIHDVLQEIRLAILVSENEKEALREAGRNCRRLLKEYGFGREFTDLDTPCFDSGISKKDYLTDDSDDSDSVENIDSNDDNDGDSVLSRMMEHYEKSKCVKEVCYNLGVNYNRQIEDSLPICYIANM